MIDNGGREDRKIAYVDPAKLVPGTRVTALQNQKICVEQYQNLDEIPASQSIGLIVLDWSNQPYDGLKQQVENAAKRAPVLAVFRSPQHGDMPFREMREIMQEAGVTDVETSTATDFDFVTRVRSILLQSERPSVLVIEDSLETAKNLVEILNSGDCNARAVHDLATARLAFKEGPIDVLVIDRELPDGEGLDFLRELRQKNIFTPTLVCTAFNGSADRVEGLEAGTNAYLGKPVDPVELRTQMRWVLKPNNDSETLVFGPLEIGRRDANVRWRGIPLKMKPRDYALLTYLAERHDLKVSKKMLARDIWNRLDYAPDMDGDPVAVAKYRLVRALKVAGVPDLIGTHDDCYFFETSPLLDFDKVGDYDS